MWNDYFDTQYERNIYGIYDKIRDYCNKSRVECVGEKNGYRIYMIDGRTRIKIPLSLKYESSYRKMEYVTDTYCLTEDEIGSLTLYLSDEFIKPEFMEVEKEKTPEEELEELKSKIETRLKQKEKKVPLEKEYTDKEIIIKAILMFGIPIILSIGAALIIHLGG